MPAKKQSGRKWTAAQKLAQSKKIKKALRTKKKLAHIWAPPERHSPEYHPYVEPANGAEAIARSIDREAIRDSVRAEILKQLPAIIEEEVRSALS